MNRTVFDRVARQDLLERLSRLQPDSQRQWGKMTAPEMVCHLKDSLEVELGKKPARIVSGAMSLAVVRWLVIYMIPWPKGKAQTAPEMLATRPAEWQADVENLRQLLNEAADHGANAEWAPHPAFGKMSGRDYGYLIYKHFNHHLTQFSV